MFYHKKKLKEFETPKKGRDRGRGRDRTRSKSRESEDTRAKKKGREQSPHPIGRVHSENPAGTDRDSDDSSDSQEELKKTERILQKATEEVEKQRKKVKKARRIKTKTATASSIFQEEDLEYQLATMERESLRKENTCGRRLRRVQNQ